MRFLECDELCEITLGEWIGLAEVAIEIQAIVPDLLCRRSLREEEYYRLDSCTRECPTRQIEDGMEIT